MASNRHLGRIITLQTLYEQEFRIDCGDKAFKLDEVLERNIDRYSKTVDDVDFIRSFVFGVSEQAKKLDTILQPIAPDWPLDQIARMDLVVLRMGAYELLHNEASVPAKVAINEAVELAKAFGGENASKFVNGVLGTLIKQKEAGTLPTDEKEEKKA